VSANARAVVIRRAAARAARALIGVRLPERGTLDVRELAAPAGRARQATRAAGFRAARRARGREHTLAAARRGIGFAHAVRAICVAVAAVRGSAADETAGATVLRRIVRVAADQTHGALRTHGSGARARVRATQRKAFARVTVRSGAATGTAARARGAARTRGAARVLIAAARATLAGAARCEREQNRTNPRPTKKAHGSFGILRADFERDQPKTSLKCNN